MLIGERENASACKSQRGNKKKHQFAREMHVGKRVRMDCSAVLEPYPHKRVAQYPFSHRTAIMPKKEKEPEEDKEKSSEKDSEKESEEKGSAVTKEKGCTVEIKPEDYARWGLGRGVDITKQKP